MKVEWYNDFTDAKVGDKVWSLMKGWGRIDEIDKDEMFPVWVEFPSGVFGYMNDGRVEDYNSYPELYKVKPEIVVPPQPKKKVKKWIWVLVDVDDDDYFELTDRRFSTKEEVESQIDCCGWRAIYAIPESEIEVEE